MSGADFRLFRAHFDNSPCSLHVVILFFIEVIALFERELKRLNPTIQRIQYSIQDVFNYIDSLPEIAFLVYALSPSLSDPLSSNDNYNGYTLIPKEGIKKRVHEVFIQESTKMRVSGNMRRSRVCHYIFHTFKCGSFYIFALIV